MTPEQVMALLGLLADVYAQVGRVAAERDELAREVERLTAAETS